MNDTELDALFAAAGAETDADLGAGARFLAGHRARQAALRQRRRGWWSAALASAAALAGLAALRPAPDAPASAAYGVYESALGDGW